MTETSSLPARPPSWQPAQGAATASTPPPHLTLETEPFCVNAAAWC